MISAVVGLDLRTTFDMDTTIKGFTLSEMKAFSILKRVCSIELEDNVQFEITGSAPIRAGDDYPGVRFTLNAIYGSLRVPISLDITTGDVITPHETNFSYISVFDGRQIDILSYPLETVLAEKIETVLSRSISNTRIRDYYDIYILHKIYFDRINREYLVSAVENTFAKRINSHIIESYTKIVEEIRSSQILQSLWDRYQEKYSYANGIEFDYICNSIQDIMNFVIESREESHSVLDFVKP